MVRGSSIAIVAVRQENVLSKAMPINVELDALRTKGVGEGRQHSDLGRVRSGKALVGL